MATIRPNRPAGSLAPETLRLYRLLKGLPDGRFCVWQRLSIHQKPGPDFWVLSHDGRSLLLKVSSATSAECRASRQPNLFGQLLGQDRQEKTVGLEEQQALEQFFGHLTHAGIGFTEALPCAVVFPNVEDSVLDAACRPESALDPIWLGKEGLRPEPFETWLMTNLGRPLNKRAIDALRKAFAPELVVPRNFTVRTPIDRGIKAELTEYLLDYDQEWMLKLDLDLSAEANTTARDFGLRLINGVAGSGKSLIVVYRAHLLRQFFPDKRLLILTHNKALIRDLRHRYRSLSGNGRSVSANTFLGWCRSLWPGDVTWTPPIGLKRREELLNQVWHQHLSDTSITARMLRDEIDWFKDRLLISRDDYMSADRKGRGFALNQYLQPRMFKAMVAYQQMLDEKGWLDWGDIPRRIWRFVEQEQVNLPTCDVILVDEAQFFAPIWFEIIKKALKPVTGHLFMVADPTQGFLKRRESWAASGLDVRGRSHRLKRSYRTTLEILDFATLLYRSRLPDDDEEIVAPDLTNMPRGVVPQIIPLTSQQDEITRVVNEIRSLVSHGVPLEHLLVIHTSWEGAERLLRRLQHEFGVRSASDPRRRAAGNHIRVITLDATTGLESPIVFLVGTHLLYEEEQSVRMSDDERAEVIRDNTRKLYMAITRAGQRLVLTYVGALPDFLQQLPAISLGRPEP